jgi:multisubunit Na+/H+ antiporter MnhB subunit
MARSSNNVVHRNGTSTKYWYTLAGYLAGAILAIGYVIVTFLQMSNEPGAGMMAGLGSALVILGISAFGIATYPALFKDSAYLRETNQRWKPKWWYYIGLALGAPIASYFLAKFLLPASESITVAVLIHALSALTMSGVYLYRRHQYVGVP